MTATPPETVQPTGNDLIRDGDDAITANAQALQALWDARAIRGTITTATHHLDNLRTPGLYAVPYNSAGAAVGMPNGLAGAVLVLDAQNTTGKMHAQIAYQYVPSSPGSAPRLQIRTAQDLSGVWTPWTSIAVGTDVERAAFFRGALTEDDHLDDLRTPGQYAVPSNAIAAAVGMPNGRAGVVTVQDSLNSRSLILQETWEYAGGGGARHWRGSSDWNGNFGPWNEYSNGEAVVTASEDHGLAHTVRLDAATRRRGGTIGTGGKAAIALRYDHGLANFRDHILPELRRLDLPWSMAVNPASWSRTENDGVTAADLQNWCLQDGGEVWNHGMTHGDASTPTDLHTEVVESLALLSTQLPKLAVEGWAVPGVGGTQYDGFGAGQSPDRWDTLAGRLILSAHAFATGHWPGRLRPLSGTPQVGTLHYGIESRTVAEATAMIDQAVATGTGLTVMMHPSLIGNGTALSVADHTAILEHIAARRDAGDLVVLTMTGLELAAAASSHAHNLLPPMGTPASVGAGSSTSRQQSLADLGHHAGAVRRIEVDIEATTPGTATIAVEGAGTKTIILPAGRTTITRHVTLPLDATRCHVTVTPSVAATVHQLAALAT